MLLAMLLACTPTRVPQPSQPGVRNGEGHVYIVELQPWVADQKQFADSVGRLLHGRVGWIYKGFKGFSITLPSDSAAAALRKMAGVKSVDRDTIQKLD